MYSCHIHFYLLGTDCPLFDIARDMPPLAHFTHSFYSDSRLVPEEARKADIILALLPEEDPAETLQALTEAKRADAECILLANSQQTVSLAAESPTLAKDIWTMPLGAEEFRFRFLRWQQAFKQSKDFLETSHFLDAVLNSSPNLIWFKDKNGIHEKVNDSFCRTVNKAKNQVEGQGHAYIWDVESDDPACIESEREVMSSQKTCKSEETVQTGEGLKLLTTYKSPLYDLDGTVMGTVGVAVDITQERAYEQEIIRKNHALEMLFTTMDCGVMCHTLDGSRILSINRAALRILGYDSQETLLADGFDMVAQSVADEDKQKLRESISALKKVDDSISLTYRVRHKDGSELHIMGNVKLVQENGELFYQRFLLDCTEQKLQEKKEQAENERRQKELTNALSIDYNFSCFFDLDTGKGFPLRLDDYCSRIFHENIPFQESMEQYIEQYVHQDDQDMLRRASSQENLRLELTNKKIYYVNYRALIDGETRYYQMKTVRAGSWDRQKGVVAGFRSVDEETRNELEKKNLLESALMQAKRASRAKSAFLSNMSHDIRTPMNAIVGFTSLALSHIDRKDQVEEYLKKIMTSGSHLLSLINDILDMSRIESGKIHLDEEVCRLPDILHGLHNIIQADVHAKQLDLFIDTVDVLDEEIYCDKLRLNQVLLNLLSNSVKYTGAGGTISLRITEIKNAPGNYANFEFCIRDTGIGMSQEFVSLIFEPFERERTSTISGIQGTGLGMAITKNIVDLMNGTIEVKSEQGKGSEFIVTFPFRIHADTRESLTIPNLQNHRVLVVDDDFNTCDSVSYMLQQMGMRAEWTLSGKEAILRTRQAVTRNDSYDIYIVDWLMPDMNGIEVARRIRKEAGENVPIVILTAYDWTEIEEEAREAGVIAFCSKPLFLSELRKCLCSIVDKDEHPKNRPTPGRAKLQTGKILLVEDNELNQEIASAILNEVGYNIDIADNGQAALDMLRTSRPGYYRLILMDVQMPVMGGYEATKLIRRLEDKELASIPILAMTANAFEEDKKEAIKCGMNGHISKPLDVEKLLETLEQILA